MDTDRYYLEKAQKENYDDYYNIRKEEKNMFWTGYSEAPNYEKFKEWYSERIDNPDRDIYLLFIGANCVGSLHIDFYSTYAAIGYSIREAYEGKGYATILVAEALEIAKQKKQKHPELLHIIAWINYQNKASVRVVEKNGFKKTNISEKRKRFDKKELYYEYKLSL